MSKVYGYGRVSTEDQSLEVQKAALEAAGCHVVMLETASGASREGRPKLALLLEALGSGDTLVVTKLGAVRYAPEVIRAKFAELGCQAKVARELGCDPKTVQRALKASAVAPA